MHYSARENLQRFVNNPKNKGLTKDQLSKSLESSVAGCSDEFKIYIEVDDDKIIFARWDGQGCAIAAGSTEALLNLIEGKKINEVNNIIDLYEKFINGSDVNVDKSLQVFEIIKSHVSRKKCALASVEAIRKGIN